MKNINWDKKNFLTSSPTITLEYQYWLNERIYNSRHKMSNPFWINAWNEFWEDGIEAKNFGLFLDTPVGQKWLKSEQGNMYKAWQTG